MILNEQKPISRFPSDEQRLEAWVQVAIQRSVHIHTTRVARWFVFKPKIPIWVNFGVYCNGKYWYIDHLVYFTAIGNMLWPFGIFFWSIGIFSPVLVFCTKKNLATLFTTTTPELHSAFVFLRI
jgi:hypothetical protein